MQIPRDRSVDSTLAFLRDPYRFISRRCRAHGSDLFETRLRLHRTICMRGSEAARLFYDPERFLRHGAPPGRIQKTLFGRGGVQGLDGDAHRHRKRMLLEIATPDRVGELIQTTADRWQVATREWEGQDRVILYAALRELLTAAVCRWAGVPLPESDVRRRTHELTALFDYAGNVGPKQWLGRLARRRADAWIESLIGDVRAERLAPPPESALHVVAWHRDLNGELLSEHVAAVELLNVVRPTVAVSVFLTFIAHALHAHPETRPQLQQRDPDYTAWFVQEVRRSYPFFPGVPAIVRRDFDWRGYRFPAGRHVILDLYGTNHDPRIWGDPDEFRPERFRDWDGSPFNFVPQGGGAHDVNHRCPGEGIAIELMKLGCRMLLENLAWEVPEQDLRIDFGRLPALPRSRFVMANVRRRDPAQANGVATERLRTKIQDKAAVHTTTIRPRNRS